MTISTFEYGAQCLSIKFGGVLIRYSTNLEKQTNAHRLKIHQESETCTKLTKNYSGKVGLSATEELNVRLEFILGASFMWYLGTVCVNLFQLPYFHIVVVPLFPRFWKADNGTNEST